MNVWISLRINIQIFVRNVQRHTFRWYFWITKQRAASDVKFRIYSSSHTHILNQPTIFRSTSKWRHEQTPKTKTHNDQYFPFFWKRKKYVAFFLNAVIYCVRCIFYCWHIYLFRTYTIFLFLHFDTSLPSLTLSSSKHIHNFVFFSYEKLTRKVFKQTFSVINKSILSFAVSTLL